MSVRRIDAVLFDLDGTLADTAPDLIGAINRVRVESGFGTVPNEQVRPFVSKGGAAMVRAAWPGVDDTGGALLRRFLDSYREHVCERTVLFAGMAETLAAIEAAGKPWGIVTNKPAWLTTPLIEKLQLDKRAGCVISGDTLTRRKPDPAPVVHACRMLGVEPRHTAMIGDDECDVQSARAAGATSVLVAWGYFGADEDTRAWGADHGVSDARELRELLQLA